MASIERRITAKGEPRWELRYRVRGREVSRTFRTRADAIACRRQIEHDDLIGVAFDPRSGKIKLDDWWEKWWPSTMHLRVSTRTRDAVMYSARIKPALGDIALADLDRATLRAWVSELRADGLAASTIHKCAQILSKTLRAAVDDGRLGRNPAERLDLPRVERQEMRFLTPSEVATLADTIGDEYRALVLLGAYGGLRLGEMLALRRNRVDLLRGTVDIAETVGHPDGRVFVGPPKTRAGRRVVPLPRIVADALELHLAGQGEARPDALLFPAGRSRGYMHGENFRVGIWHPAVARAGLTPLRPHDLRHTAVALWIAAGASPKEIAARAGHTSVVTVLDRYGHLLPGSEDKVNAALDALADAATATPSAAVVPLVRDGRGMDAAS
jgi:integrase